MPERPKRRKNNKNKRKNNKGNRTNITDHNSCSSASADVSSSVDILSENLISVENAEQPNVCLESVANITPIDKICYEIGSGTCNENASKPSLVKNEAETFLEKEDIQEESLETYVVETPDQNKKFVPKLTINSKSKSVDNDDSPTIVEITDDDSIQVTDSSLTLIDSDNCIISDSDSDVLWQKVDDLVNFNIDPEGNPITGALSITTIPLNIAQCNQIKSLSPEEELSLRCYLKTLNLSTNPEYASTSEIKSEIEQVINREIKNRLRKRGLAEDSCMLRVGPSRSLALDVIDEEGSSESSVTSRRQSSLIDKKSDNEELEDDVFESKTIQISKSKLNNVNKRNINIHTIPQECILVDAKLKEPEVSEACGSWTTKIVEKITGAELVYLTDSSSSTSSIYDVNEDNEHAEDNDKFVRIITPTIEVTDTAKLLTELSKNKIVENSSDSNLSITSASDADKDFSKDEMNDGLTNHEILIESTDNIKTDLIVKGIEKDTEHIVSSLNEIALQRSPKAVDKYDLEIKVLKCELNDAINNLIKEVSSDSESIKDCSNDLLSRQDSSSSVGSSQCTAKYNPTHSSLNDVSGIINDNHDSTCEPSSHVKDVIEHLPQSQAMNNLNNGITKTPSLRDLCLQKISALPYGDKILEELAQVSTRLQHLSALSVINNTNFKTIKTDNRSKTRDQFYEKNESAVLQNTYTPPPILPRKSSLKTDDRKPKVPPKPDHIHKCFSPSQKMLMEKTNTIVAKEQVKGTENSYKTSHTDEKGNVMTSSLNKNSNTSPFKSQTGSRLLSLICDTSINNNISSSLKSVSSKRLDHMLKDQNTKTLTNFESKSEYFPSKNLPSSPKHKTLLSSFYESGDSSEYKGNFYKNIQNERKYFHYSTGNLNSEIEDDISSIQNMHRYYTDIRNERKKDILPRRPSLPRDLCDQQMEYIRQKEKEVDAEIRRLEHEKRSPGYKKGPRAPMISDSDDFTTQTIYSQIHKASKQSAKLPSLFSSSEEELRREKMYTEYVNQMAEREFRKEHKIIKITKPVSTTKSNSISHSMPILDPIDSKVNNRIEREFITKARQRWDKLGIKESEMDEVKQKCDLYSEPKIIEHKIKVIEAGKEKDVNNLPNHLQDFVKFTAMGKEREAESTAVWRPGAPPVRSESPSASGAAPPPPPPPPVWLPSSASASPQLQRKTFRPVQFEESPPARRKVSADQNGCTSGSENEGRLRTSHSAPVTGLNSLGSSASRLPRAQNPTVTLLQKARDERLSHSSNHIQQERDPRLPRDRPSPPRGDPVHALRKEYASESEAERSDYERGSRKMADAPKKIDGIGPTTKDGMPVALRSEVKDPSRWYKKMYDTIHKNKYDEDYVTIRYKNQREHEALQRPASNRSQYAYFDPRSGYLSEPEGRSSRLASSTWSDAYDSDVTSGPRRRTASVQEESRNNIESPYLPSNKYSTLASARASQEVYKNQPGRIENYVPGRSSVIDKEAKQWWDEVMDIFDGQHVSNSSLPTASPKEKKDITSTILSKSNMARALKESGYESDSTLIFRRREDTEAPLSPAERRAAYRDLQAGGEPPLRGFRSPAPPRQDETEIEYIPITSTLTKIRVHKKFPNVSEMICYPIQKIQKDMQNDSKYNKHREKMKDLSPYPPDPPQRVSSKNSRTLQLVASTESTTDVIKTRKLKDQSNVDFLKDKINHKLNRQNTHVIIKKRGESIPSVKNRAMSSSAPPAINRLKITNAAKVTHKPKTANKQWGTSSFSSPRRTLLPTEYPSTREKSESSSVIVYGGVGRKTPITNILDKVTSLDKLWSSQKRNERIDMSKIKSAIKDPRLTGSKNVLNKPKTLITPKPSSCNPVPHKSRDMTRTSEKIQKNKKMDLTMKSNICLSKLKNENIKLNAPKTMFISKSSPNIASSSKKEYNQIRTAVIKDLKKKKYPENISKKRNDKELFGKKPKEVIKIVKGSKDTFEKSDQNFYKNDQQIIKNAEHSDLHEDYNSLPYQSLDIKSTRDAIVSDSFFQHLFLRNSCMSSHKTILDSNATSMVLQRAKLFQSLPETRNYLFQSSPLNTYLIHRKPVSLSRFILHDRSPSPIYFGTSRSISWPGKMDGKIRKFESLKTSDSELGSTLSLATIRSRSEPPRSKLYFSQTSRPVSPTVIFHKQQKKSDLERSSLSPYKTFHSNKSRQKSPYQNLEYNLKLLSPNTLKFSIDRNVSPKADYCNNTENKIPTTLFFSQTSRPVSPKVTIGTSYSRSQSTSPVSIRSPSYRRIHLARANTKLDIKKEIRTHSADDIKKRVTPNNFSIKTRSENNLYCNDPEYDEYIQDIHNTKTRSERFRELNRYYAYLERVAELEKTTMINDAIFRKKDEEIIDFDRWKKIRSIERAEEELNNLYMKLKRAQQENDILFYPRDIKDFRWNFNKERGLKIKEKSVEDLKEEFLQKSSQDLFELESLKSKDTYKPLWRGKSVAETAFDINKKNKPKQVERRSNKQHVVFNQDSLQELRKKIGIGNRLWSSLSIDQVAALKNQLNAIYSKELESKTPKEEESYSVEVEDIKNIKKDENLYVRCTSLVTPRSTPVPNELSKSESIAAIASPIHSEKDMKNNVNKLQMALSENEKRKISQTIGKEILNKIHKYDSSLSKRSGEKDFSKNVSQKNVIDHNIQAHSTRKEDCNVPILLNENREEQNISEKKENFNVSSSETDTGSSDVSSNKTVIYKGDKKEVQKKVEYFESVKKAASQCKTIYRAGENPECKEKNELAYNIKKPDSESSQICQSQSCTNIKDLFGESEKNKYMSLPSKPTLYSRSPSPHSEVHVSDIHALDTLPFSSDETLWRSRSPSPDRVHYWRTYLNFSKKGQVRRLARHFDLSSTSGAILRRHRSDPEIARNEFKNNWPMIEKDSVYHGKYKPLLTVGRVPLRSTNRFMPHIDIISKLAALRKRTTTRSRSAEEALECRPGEVERIRRKFETMTILGQIYTSAPDVRELKDIEHHLAGPWIAHRYPKPKDNNRCATNPKIFVRGRTSPVKKVIKQQSPKESVNLSSILKTETLDKQMFDPLAHRPASRYEPPRTPPRPPSAAWPYRLAATFDTPSRHTVTFEDTDSAPVPPSRTTHGSFSDSESPNRRYVESDVNIHYRCPVRHDPLPLVPERELARQQAEHMKRLYREQKRNKYLQENDIQPNDIEAFDASIKELQDMQNRRHQDNFMPSQKTVVPLNRYDEAEKVIARALYTFNGQTSRELSFRKGDFINVRRQIDANWYEGEIQGRIGLFPYNYVELLKGDGTHSPKKPSIIEGRARAKFDFTAQTNLELPLKKGEVVVLTRRIDHNWWEGRNGNKTGIFPDSYVTVLQEPSQNKPESVPILNTSKPVASPAAHGLVNGADKRSLGAHTYTPQHNSPALANAPPAQLPLASTGYATKTPQATLTPSERGYGPPKAAGVDLNNTEPLYVDTNAEAVPYRAMYKYRPQNPDELELNEGDTVYVLEKCDDGWYVGSSQRTGRFGTFPGNYVERI